MTKLAFTSNNGKAFEISEKEIISRRKINSRSRMFIIEVSCEVKCEDDATEGRLTVEVCNGKAMRHKFSVESSYVFSSEFMGALDAEIKKNPNIFAPILLGAVKKQQKLMN